jgi:hypothetical protein
MAENVAEGINSARLTLNRSRNADPARYLGDIGGSWDQRFFTTATRVPSVPFPWDLQKPFPGISRSRNSIQYVAARITWKCTFIPLFNQIHRGSMIGIVVAPVFTEGGKLRVQTSGASDCIGGDGTARLHFRHG